MKELMEQRVDFSVNDGLPLTIRRFSWVPNKKSILLMNPITEVTKIGQAIAMKQMIM